MDEQRATMPRWMAETGAVILGLMIGVAVIWFASCGPVSCAPGTVSTTTTLPPITLPPPPPGEPAAPVE